MPERQWFFNHDCSTLGGNSGSLVADVERGSAVGLHFGGAFRQTNYAVRADQIRKLLERHKVVSPVSRLVGDTDGGNALEAPPRPASAYDDREGYELDFLGQKPEHRVPLPRAPGNDVAPVKGATGAAKGVLRYQHFSVSLCKSRRLAWYTAVNIDGAQSRNVPRKGDAWYFDPRVDKKFQAGPEVYANNDLDRGQMVRRLDPVWGSEADSKLANDDTFHFANACPQHKDLNQRTWNDLEDYILGNSDARNLKVCVFTGPVLRDDDPPYRTVLLPREFWKVAVLVNDATGKLSATGYVLSQAGMIKDLTEFVFGQFRTYQVPLAAIEQSTGLDFGGLKAFDPLKDEDANEAVGGRVSRVVNGPRDLVF